VEAVLGRLPKPPPAFFAAGAPAAVLDDDGINLVSYLVEILTDPVTGFGRDYDDLIEADFVGLANDLDEPSWRRNPAFTSGQDENEVLDRFLREINGYRYERGGKLGIGRRKLGVSLAGLPQFTHHQFSRPFNPKFTPAHERLTEVTVKGLTRTGWELTETAESYTAPASREIAQAPARQTVETWASTNYLLAQVGQAAFAFEGSDTKDGTLYLRADQAKINGERLKPGDLFILDHPQLQTDEAYMAEEVSLEGIGEVAVKVSLAPGQQPLPYVAPLDPEPDLTEPEPIPFTSYRLWELPAGLHQGAKPAIAVLVEKGEDTHMAATVHYSLDGGGSYRSLGVQTGFAVRGTLSAALSENGTTVALHTASIGHAARLQSQGSDAQAADERLLIIGAEVLSLGDVTADGGGNYTAAHVLRGRQYSAQTAHASGAECWIVERADIIPRTAASFEPGATRHMKLQPWNAFGPLALGDTGIVPIAFTLADASTYQATFSFTPALPLDPLFEDYRILLASPVKVKRELRFAGKAISPQKTLGRLAARLYRYPAGYTGAAEPEEVALLFQTEQLLPGTAEWAFRFTLEAPAEPGDYRLFFFAYDWRGAFADANYDVSFQVAAVAPPFPFNVTWEAADFAAKATWQGAEKWIDLYIERQIQITPAKWLRSWQTIEANGRDSGPEGVLFPLFHNGVHRITPFGRTEEGKVSQAGDTVEITVTNPVQINKDQITDLPTTTRVRPFYRRSSSDPLTPSGGSYDTPPPNWSIDVPSTPAWQRVYITIGEFGEDGLPISYSAPSPWNAFDGDPGGPGQPGTDGQQQRAWFRESSSTPSTPSGGTYSSGPVGWSATPPASPIDHVYVSWGTYLGNGQPVASGPYTVPVKWDQSRAISQLIAGVMSVIMDLGVGGAIRAGSATSFGDVGFYVDGDGRMSLKGLSGDLDIQVGSGETLTRLDGYNFRFGSKFGVYRGFIDGDFATYLSLGDALSSIDMIYVEGQGVQLRVDDGSFQYPLIVDFNGQTFIRELNANDEIKVNGTKVLGERAPAIGRLSDLTGGNSGTVLSAVNAGWSSNNATIINANFRRINDKLDAILDAIGKSGGHHGLTGD